METKNSREERLSPNVRKLLEDTRKKFAHSPGKARKHLSSVNPQEMTMYDRQKIGREILMRYNGGLWPSISHEEDFLNGIQQKYDLPITKYNPNSGKYEKVMPLIGKERIWVHKRASVAEREMTNLVNISHSERLDFLNDRRLDDSFREAVSKYTKLDMTSKTIECYDLRIAYARETQDQDTGYLVEKRNKLLETK